MENELANPIIQTFQGARILIIEDQSIEASALRFTLEEAGYPVCGVANCYEDAMLLINQERPQMVLLDIYLKGTRTGVDLGKILSKEGIPFIYISANSNQTVLEAAKATRPYGFLLKPFRDRDILMALDIATYRHSHTVALISRQETVLSEIMRNLIDQTGLASEKFLQLIKALNAYIPFDHIHFDTNVRDEDLNAVLCYRRIDFNDFDFLTGEEVRITGELDYKQYNNWRLSNSTAKNVRIENGSEFEEACVTTPFLGVLRTKYAVHSRLVVPLVGGYSVPMGIRLYSKGRETYNADHLELINPLRSLLSLFMEKIGSQFRSEEQVPARSLQRRKPAVPGPVIEGIVGNSPRLLEALDQAKQAAAFDVSVLVLGETGVGKEGLVQAIHRLSKRSKKPLVKINCAAVPASLIESELFGHEKGAFTGAVERRIGRFEQANGGTIFLDEIGEIPLETQIKLLRVLQEREFERIGGRTTIKIDVRVIAATNRNLYQDVADGKFRMDLYFRINVFPIQLAPLRERKGDIPLLVSHFLDQFARQFPGSHREITPAAMEQLLAYHWPGNIRELQHVIERHIVLCKTGVITHIELPRVLDGEKRDTVQQTRIQSIEDMNREHIIAVLKKCNGRVSGKGGAAELLNIPATTLSSKMKKLGISWKYIT
jgi:DNA-binding NtrC family response regulator